MRYVFLFQQNVIRPTRPIVYSDCLRWESNFLASTRPVTARCVCVCCIVCVCDCVMVIREPTRKYSNIRTRTIILLPFQTCYHWAIWKLKTVFQFKMNILNVHLELTRSHSGGRPDWARPGLARRFETTRRRRIEYRSDDVTKELLLDFSVLDTMYWWSMMKNIHSPNWVGIGSWGPEIWPHEYLISPIEISVNWPGSKQLWTRPIYTDFNGAN